MARTLYNESSLSSIAVRHKERHSFGEELDGGNNFRGMAAASTQGIGADTGTTGPPTQLLDHHLTQDRSRRTASLGANGGTTCRHFPPAVQRANRVSPIC